jgi:hypothetical protein
MPFNGNFVRVTRRKDAAGKDVLAVEGTSNRQDVARVKEIRLVLLKPGDLPPEHPRATAGMTPAPANGLRVTTIEGAEEAEQWTVELRDEPLPEARTSVFLLGVAVLSPDVDAEGVKDSPAFWSSTLTVE